ncbi:MAG: hypothetical protein FGF53_09580, partial [Candidatus Brockarchaeota archaeon]|nr:hypothetical protein [Candidatus Brockarchaeota archaeon]
MSNSLQEVVQEVLKRVKPSQAEEEKVNRVLSNTVLTLRDEFKKLEPEADVLI